MTTSLSDIRPGDRVILRYSAPFRPDRVEIVDRVTKTRIIVGTQRFWISNGRELGGDQWAYYRISPATPSAIAEVERQQQNEKDQERACQLATQVVKEIQVRVSPNAAAAIPHLEAALAAINQK